MELNKIAKKRGQEGFSYPSSVKTAKVLGDAHETDSPNQSLKHPMTGRAG